jgi:hypothetical protein
MNRRFGRWAGAAVAIGLVIVLSLPDHDRQVGLYGFVLLVGAIVLGSLVAVIAGGPRAQDGPLVATQAPGAIHPDDLVWLEREVRAALDTGLIDDRLRERIETVTTTRLARSHGIDLRRNGAAAQQALAETVLWPLVSDLPEVARTRRRSPDLLALAIADLERL